MGLESKQKILFDQEWFGFLGCFDPIFLSDGVFTADLRRKRPVELI